MPQHVYIQEGREKLNLGRIQDIGDHADEDQKATWQKLALAWRYDMDSVEDKMIRELHRTASYDWLLCLDNAVQQICGNPETKQGLNMFVHKYAEGQDKDTPHLEQRGVRQAVLVVNMDRGPSGMCPLWFCIYFLSLHMLGIPDESHDNWNVVLGSIRDCGWTGVMHLMIWVLDLPHGPWEASKFWTDLVNGSWELLAHIDENDCMLLWLLPLIVEDMQWLSEEHGIPFEATARGVIEWIKASKDWLQLGTKIAPSRWFAFLKAYRDWRPYKHLRFQFEL